VLSAGAAGTSTSTPVTVPQSPTDTPAADRTVTAPQRAEPHTAAPETAAPGVPEPGSRAAGAGVAEAGTGVAEADLLDVVIIGSGPAGYTAAIYAGRAQLNTVVLEGSVTGGGALMNTTEVENFPGFPDGVQGPDLMAGLRAQAERFGAALVREDAVIVNLTGSVKVITTGDGARYRSRAVILATGSAYRSLGLPEESALTGHGLSWCATCDGFFFRGHDIAVIGGGDSAMEEALFLSRFAASVTVVVRSGMLRASKVMAARAAAESKISFQWHSEVTQILGADAVTGLQLRDTRTGVARNVAVTGVFIAVGHVPRSELLVGQTDLDSAGYVRVSSPGTATSADGVFACGDLVDHTYRQAITAAGSGCAAALDTERWLAAYRG
jgi:thioredoxin reductase (NADPH)